MSYTTVFTSIMGKSSFGLLIDLHLQNYFPIDQAIMYYNYLGIFVVVLWATFASQSNESRYLFTTPVIAAVMVGIGWLHASDPTQYWGSILMCILLGAFMYINDMNHEKFGLPGPGDKLMTVAVLIICFTATFGFIASSQFGLFGDTNAGTTQKDMNCGKMYTCDSAGNIVLDASITTIQSSGGLTGDVFSIAAALPTMFLTFLKLVVVIVGAVVLFPVVILAAYPFLMDSPQVVGLLALMGVAIWVIYAMALFRLIYKPMGTGGDV